MTPLDDLRAAVEAAAGDLRGNGGGDGGARPTLERPKKAGFGDYSTNAALLLARTLGEPPRAVAERLGDALRGRLAERVDRVEVAGPGFLNLFLADAWYLRAVDDVLAAGEGFGAAEAGPGERIQIEFVSANPTGPLTAASGRHAAFGDALARILELAGNRVDREYYFNDSGGQVQRLGQSIRARARGEAPPEDGYHGEYVAELAAEIPGAADREPAELAAAGVEIMIARIRATLDRYRVRFDRWFLEATLYEGDPSPWDRARARLAEAGLSYEADGALWLRATDLGDDKDRVLVRSTGEPTYFAADVAYHWDKLARGYDRLVNVLGADHHGYVARLKAAVAAVGADPGRLEVPILQFVHVVEGGERASMSKRRGDFVTLDELIEEIGVDATRWFMLSRSHESTVDLDLTLARAQSSENPVYYVQYAHARIASMLRKAGAERVEAALAAPRKGLALEPAERELVRRLLAFPAEVREAADRRAPHRIAAYALELAQVFTAFYRDCRVVGAEPEGLESFRIALSVATQRVIARALGLLGVSAPETM
ncbi:MAG TPA: arginine--tRNA ligase [Solirubrobacteraceae bacterium]|nr:arginine--tRNA ligase [Solirubrobacteraceae bacterium]